MGVYVTRTLKSNYHVQTYIKDNMDNKINFMSRIPAEHGNLNRVEFGDALWNLVLRPSISHCCGAWLTSSKENEDLLSSIQFRAAKIIIKTKVNMSKAALLIELGWEPINDFLNRQRASYFSYINNLPNKRLVFDEMHPLSAHAWDYLSALKTVFESVGLDYLYHVNDFNKERFNAFMGQFSSTILRNEIMSKSSLRDYITFYRHKGKQPYLEDMRDFEGSRLKFLCRTNSLCLNNLQSKMRLKNSNKCFLCNIIEDLCHFLLLCPVLEKIRRPLLNDISFNTVIP